MNPECDFYVTMRRGERVAWLAGPFGTHAEALALVESAARDVHGGTRFDVFGTASLPRCKGNPVGMLNGRLGINANVRK